MNINTFLIKLSRFCAWAMLFVFLAYIVSGYGMTKEVINPITAKYIHEILLPIPFFIMFVIHIGVNARIAFIRWKWGSHKWVSWYLIFLSLFFLVFFLWLYFI